MVDSAGGRTVIAEPLSAVVDVCLTSPDGTYSSAELGALARVRIARVVRYSKGQVLRRVGTKEDSAGGLGGTMGSIAWTSAIHGYDKRVEVQAVSTAPTRGRRGEWAADVHKPLETTDLKIVYSADCHVKRVCKGRKLFTSTWTLASAVRTM
jgi:hypothetical protein